MQSPRGSGLPARPAVEALSAGPAGGSPEGVRQSFDSTVFVPERVNCEISRRYRLDKREIGRGGFGKVFVAEDREVAGRKVAVKKVMIHDDASKQAFQKEVLIMKELDHPNICKILETYEQGCSMYIIMEFCDGGEVFDRIVDEGMIAEHDTAAIVRQVACALCYAHGKNIAHRDLKPENLVFCSKDPADSHVKVIDWGVSFYFGLSRMYSTVGSVAYIAPEVLEATGGGYDAACDVWSLGVVAYVMLCGKAPFWGNVNAQMNKMKHEDYPMSSSTWQAVSEEGRSFVRGLLRADPRARLSIDEVVAHPWLGARASRTDPGTSLQVLGNLRQFSLSSRFFSLCAASVARQLDHRSLRDVHRVFSEMDTNGDGVLELQEVRSGFEKIFGEGSEELRDLERMFERLDLDGSGTIDYTEFCAAGIGERTSTEVHALRAAFKAFDVEDGDGRITKDEIKQVLLTADVNQVWSTETCEEMAGEILERFDCDGDGSIDFDEWQRLVRECAGKRLEDKLGIERSPEEKEFLAKLEVTECMDRAYGFLTEADRRPKGAGAAHVGGA